MATNTFSTAATSNCTNNAAVAAGVLGDEGEMQFNSSMAFRRSRWVQETFMCSRFPAEQTGTLVKYPGGTLQLALAVEQHLRA